MKKKDISNYILKCKSCNLISSCNGPVVGRGNINSKILFVGEAPGAEEDRQGLPFVGRSGKLLDKTLGDCGYNDCDIYITNIVKCRPPKNRNPRTEEIKACLPHLKNQIFAIKPKIIVTLGNFSSVCLLSEPHNKKTISNLRGKTYWSDLFNCCIYPVFHPAATLYDSSKKAVFIKDIKNLKTYLDK